ncbi:hypothetical protein AAL_07695 [Moelleriella libera RCEF 2490]|uniref:Protein kinase-like domain protein n=1 Tax=Moelleriella libera RCEF 2490 TaxID=1081109 RepID=A0A167WXN5_9HYPO|nr:hypothetical protein AAL_07695 [Moelleriella libera RCEF 2490]
MYGVWSGLIRSRSQIILDVTATSWNTALRLTNSTLPRWIWRLTGHILSPSNPSPRQTREGCSCKKKGWIEWLWHSLRFRTASRLIPRFLSFQTEQPRQAVAQPITPPQRAQIPDHHQIIVDYNRTPYCIMWRHELYCPDLGGFPTLTNANVNPINQTATMKELWTQSVAFGYGSCASVRIQEDVCFPILKLAHSEKHFMQMIQYEFALLTSMARLDLPVVQIDQEPILENGEMCGF